MPRRVFFSFHFDNDYWRTQQIRNIGAIEQAGVASPNRWEEIKRAGDEAIKRWINATMDGRSCVIVLVGAETAGRKWINYEIQKAWDDGRGVFGIRIHKLKDNRGFQSRPGDNPFMHRSLRLGTLLGGPPLYEPPGATSAEAYGYIADNLEHWIETSVASRRRGLLR